MVKTTEIISHQDFGEWVCKNFAIVSFPHLQNIISTMLPNRQVA